MRTSLTLLACLWHLAAPAEAQSSNPFVFNGTVKSVDASSVSLTSEESGALNTFRLGPNLLVIRNMPASLADIRVKVPGGESELILDSGIPVTAVVPLHPSLLKAGDKVRLQGANTSDGVLIHRITLR